MGGLITVPMSKVRHVFMSPGPIFEIDTDEPDYFRGARAMYAGGFRPGDVVYNTFSYHLTPAGIMMELALRALGCAVVPGGVGNTELQLDAIAAIRPTGYVGTPSFLKILIEKAAELGKDISSIKHAFVGAEALPPSLRQMFIDKGMTCLQSYGTADRRHHRLRVRSRDRGHDRRRGRDRGDRAARHRRSGARGRCRRGRGHDLQPRLSADPLRHRRHVGGAGRAPARAGAPTCASRAGWAAPTSAPRCAACSSIPSRSPRFPRSIPGLGRLRLVIDWVNQADVMTLKVEAAQPSADLEKAMEGTIRTVCKVGGKVEFAKPGSLPNDGKVIDDVRKYT